jgi:ABC-type lipoprotein release transport system permease subunit
VGVLKRGVRNVYRSGTRAVLVILLLGLAVGVFLTMAQAAAGIAAQTGKVGGALATLIEVRAAGASGMGQGQDALPVTFFERAKQVPNVERAEPALYQRMRDPGKDTPITIAAGVQPGGILRVAFHGELGDPKIVEGRNFTPVDAGEPLAIVGTALAETHELDVGSEWTLKKDWVALEDRPDPDAQVEDLTVRVIGIYDAGFRFGNNQVFIPLDVAQRTFDQEDKATHVFAAVNSVENMPQVERDLRQAFGDEADVISGQETVRAYAQTLQSIQGNSLLAAGVALAVGERTREIGTLKAIGASGRQVGAQFAAEAVALALVGGLVGLIIYLVAGTALASLLLGAASAGQATTFVGGENPLSSLGLTYGLSAVALAAVVVAVLVLSLLGSLYPAARTARTSPTEALRYEA